MLGPGNVIGAALIHILFFAVCCVTAIPFRSKDVVIPIDLTVIMEENLDGNDDEPPPTEKPTPQPEPPKPTPPPEPTPPPPEPEKPVDAVVKDKPKEEKKIEKPKPPEPKPPEKTKAQLREERMKRARESASKVVTPEPPQPNGRTDKQTLTAEERARLLALGATPGRSEQMPADEEQLCISLIYKEFYSKWDSPAYSAALREMVLRVEFDRGGRVVAKTLVQRSGDAAADRTVEDAAARVKYVAGLTPEFLRRHPTVDVRFKVKMQ